MMDWTGDPPLDEHAQLQPADLGIGALFDVVPDIVLVLELPALAIALANAPAGMVFGHAPAELCGRALRDVLGPAAHTAVDAHLADTPEAAPPSTLLLSVGARDRAPMQVQATVALLEGPTDRTSRYAVLVMDDLDRRSRTELRCDALLGVARRLALVENTTALVQAVIQEAAALWHTRFATLFRWDEVAGQAIPLAALVPPPGGQHLPILPGQGLSGQVLLTRRPLVVRDYQHEFAPDTSQLAQDGRAAGMHATMAAPLIHDGRLLGVLSVATHEPQTAFDAEDVTTLELLASVAAAALVGQAQQRLSGVQLAARTAQHELNNQLSLTVGYCELALQNPELSAEVRTYLQQALDGAREAAQSLQRLRAVTQVEERTVGDETPLLVLPG